MKLHYIKPQDLKQVWTQIKPSLTEMSQHGNLWIPEDAYCDIRENRAHLHLILKDDMWQGYIITQVFENRIHIWAAYGKNKNLMQFGLDEIKNIAQASNIHEITFTSHRKGWNKVAYKLGFQPQTWSLKC